MTEPDPARTFPGGNFFVQKQKLYKKIFLFSLKYVAKVKLIV